MLQFKIERHIAGAVEGNEPEAYSLEEKRRQLRDWAESWKTLWTYAPQAVSIGPIPWHSHCSGATFLTLLDDHRTVLFKQIGSKARRIPACEQVSHKFNFDIRCNYFDQSLDLLVLVQVK